MLVTVVRGVPLASTPSSQDLYSSVLYLRPQVSKGLLKSRTKFVVMPTANLACGSDSDSELADAAPAKLMPTQAAPTSRVWRRMN